MDTLPVNPETGRPPVNPETGRPRRLHLMTYAMDACTKCAFTVIKPYLIERGDCIDPEDTRPLATADAALWRACPFNCELVPPPAGKKQTPIASP